MLISTWLLLEILAVVTLLIVGLYIYYKLYIFNFWRKKGVPYMQPLFPIGNLMPFVSGKLSQAEVFKNIYDQHKKDRLVGMYMLHKPYLVVKDPDLIRDVLAKQFTNFHDRGIFHNQETDPLSGNLFQLPGKPWRNLRVKLTPTFTSGKMKQMFPIIKETGDTLAKYLENEARTGATIDVKEVFACYSVDIIMSAAFGIVCNSFTNPNNEFRYWGRKIFAPKLFRNAILFLAPHIFDVFSIPYTEKAVTNFFTKMFRETVEYREANNITRKDFLNLLMQLMKNGYLDVDESTEEVNGANNSDIKTKLTMVEAAAQAYAFYLAGFETSSTTVTFCLYELAKNQHIQDKVREEIQAVIKKHGELTYNTLNSMSYLHKVISETLRKYPAVPMLNRICTKETQLEGTHFRIPKDTSLVIPVFGLHRDPEIYPDPDKFDPERFSEENIKTRHPYAYLPFGEGPRICIGLRFGMVQTKVAIISALLKTRFKLPPNKPTSLEFEAGALVIMAKEGVHLTIESI